MLTPEPRIRKRVPCRITVAHDVTHTGMVLNVSRTGLFVQTSAVAEPGADLGLELSPDGATLPLRAEVRWRRIVAPHLRSVQNGGIGVRLQHAPEAYFRFVWKALDPDGARAATDPDAAGTALDAPDSREFYRVQLKQDGGPRSRWLRVQADSPDGAGQAAIEQLGPGWSILAVRLA